MSCETVEPLIGRLQKLSFQHQLFFACCCCERVISTYRDVAEDEGWEEEKAGLLECAMEQLWAAVHGKEIPPAQVESLHERIDSVMNWLNERKCHWQFTALGILAGAAVFSCLDFYLQRNTRTLEETVQIPSSLVEHWLDWVSNYNPQESFWGPDDSELARRWALIPPCGASSRRPIGADEQQYRHSRIVQAEVDKQRFDVEVLEMHPVITNELIALLRRSSSMQGVQLHWHALRMATARARVVEVRTDPKS
jgi:hypothetical protein